MKTTSAYEPDARERFHLSDFLLALAGVLVLCALAAAVASAKVQPQTAPGDPLDAHFLNVATGRPVWRFKDGSFVEATRKVAVPAGSANIAWLLLETAVAGE